MRRFALVVSMVLLTLRVFAAEGEWLTDLEKAQEKARTEKKLVLMDFTGSDWCVSCKQLRDDVLTSKDFVEFAKANLVLVEVDIPMHKPQSPDLERANKELQRKFKVQMFPTLVVLNGKGKELGRLRYSPSFKTGDYIAQLKKLQRKAA